MTYAWFTVDVFLAPFGEIGEVQHAFDLSIVPGTPRVISVATGNDKKAIILVGYE